MAFSKEIFIGVGTNIGNLSFNVETAIRLLEKNSIIPLNISNHYLTKPWGGVEQPDFLNLVLQVNTNYSAISTMETLLAIEQEMGRIRTDKWGPRIIDLDLLVFKNQIIDSDFLKIPHPFCHQREFVLRPWVEIAPLFIHPILKTTILNIWNQYKSIHEISD